MNTVNSVGVEERGKDNFHFIAFERKVRGNKGLEINLNNNLSRTDRYLSETQEPNQTSRHPTILY